MVEYSSESSRDKEAHMCVVEWSWGSKSKPFICSSLKPASKSQQDEMHYTSDIAKCDGIFDYLLQEKQIKLPSGSLITCCRKNKLNCQVVMSYCHWNSSICLRIVNGIILILMPLTIAMFSADRLNQL
jgi:hypothetical protein